MKLLVSVRSLPEALIAAEAGVHLIDLKEPRDGALGALALPTVRAIVAGLRGGGHRQPISATTGDMAADDLRGLMRRIEVLAECGVELVKVGVEPGDGARQLLAALARCETPVVPVFIADRGVHFSLLDAACDGPFPALMLDTADKRSGSLLERVAVPELRRFIERVQRAGLLAGLAGSLQIRELPRLQALAPHFAGFRSAVCAGDRGGALDRNRVAELLLSLTDEPTHNQPATRSDHEAAH